MNAVEFFLNPCVKLPIQRGKDDTDFEAFVKGRCEAYVEFIRTLVPSDSITEGIKKELTAVEALCQLIQEAIHEYLVGMPHKAYERLDNAITRIPSHFGQRIKNVTHRFLNELYRIRVEQKPVTKFGKTDLFHIPFQDRHKVRRQRYSIPGLPCLYLGGSLYVCWEEMDRPSFDSIYMARFKVVGDDGVKVLFFIERPIHVAARLQQYPGDICDFPGPSISYAVCWPLMAASSIRRKEPDAAFIAEYIVPQLILQYITHHHDLDGIVYSSVRLDSDLDDAAALCNLVFPARAFTPTGSCNALKRKFAMTQPVHWPLLDSMDVTASPAPAPRIADMQVELISGHRTLYKATAFGRLEGKLLQLACETF